MKDINAAMNAVMKEVGYVQKQGGRNINYTYAGEAALIAAIRPALVANGIVVYPASVDDLSIDTYTTSKGSVMNRAIVRMTYRFVHAESGTSIEVVAVGEGSDVGDKSVNKASTGAYKYALRQAFVIETGDDPDEFASEPRGNGKQVEKLITEITATPEPKGRKPTPQVENAPHKKKPEVVKWLVSEKIANNVPNAGALYDLVNSQGEGGNIDKLLNASKGEEVRDLFRLYRRWRTEGGLDPQPAAIFALEGKTPEGEPNE